MNLYDLRMLDKMWFEIVRVFLEIVIFTPKLAPLTKNLFTQWDEIYERRLAWSATHDISDDFAAQLVEPPIQYE